MRCIVIVGYCTKEERKEEDDSYGDDVAKCEWRIEIKAKKKRGFLGKKFGLRK